MKFGHLPGQIHGELAQNQKIDLSTKETINGMLSIHKFLHYQSIRHIPLIGPEGSMKTGRLQMASSTPQESKAYTDAIDYLYNRINFEKSQDQPYNQQNFRLSRMERLLVQIGNPQQASPVIHIAGSKGKGSVAWLTAEVLRRGGYQTGLYTSPHLVCLEERFVINGKPISQDDLAQAIQAISPAVDEIATLGHGQATFFEITTAIAWWVFRKANCDVVVCEVGLGGRLDSTNVCWPTLSIITSISYDHQLQLGNTLAEIASEKAGIIKPGVPVISGVINQEPQEVIHRIAKERGCQLRQIGRDFHCYRSDTNGAESDRHDRQSRDVEGGALIDYAASNALWQAGSVHRQVRLRMLGEHQVSNCGIVLATVDLLREQGWKISNEAVYLALLKTQLIGRIQIVSENPLIILDTAHNEASIAALISTLQDHFGERKMRFVFAASKDKKYRSMLRQLYEVATELHLTQFEHNPRTVPVDELVALIPTMPTDPSISCFGHSTPEQALKAAVRDVQPSDLVCITGSFFLAAELIPILNQEF